MVFGRDSQQRTVILNLTDDQISASFPFFFKKPPKYLHELESSSINLMFSIFWFGYKREFKRAGFHNYQN